MSIAHQDAERRAERLASAIYGTIVVAGVLAATGPDDDPQVGYSVLWVLVTVVVFWLAHAWALSIARRIERIRVGRGGFRETLATTWLLVGSALPPLAVMLVASALGATDEGAILLAGWTCVALLAGSGVAVGRAEDRSKLGILGTAAACAALGGFMIALKTILH